MQPVHRYPADRPGEPPTESQLSPDRSNFPGQAEKDQKIFGLDGDRPARFEPKCGLVDTGQGQSAAVVEQGVEFPTEGGILESLTTIGNFVGVGYERAAHAGTGVGRDQFENTVEIKLVGDSHGSRAILEHPGPSLLGHLAKHLLARLGQLTFPQL